MSMSQKIREAMKARGMSQSDVCAATGMKPTLLARMLRDDDHNYTVKTLSRIAAALETDLSIEFGNKDSTNAWADLYTKRIRGTSGGGTDTEIKIGDGGYISASDIRITYGADPLLISSVAASNIATTLETDTDD